MKKATRIAMALFLTAVWSVAIAMPPTANPTVAARKQMVEKMKERHKLKKERPRVKKIEGTVDRSLKPRPVVIPVRTPPKK